MKGIIYKIESSINNKIYIGMTTRDIEYRWYEHKRELKTNSHHNIKLQRHYNKYGDVFIYSVIEEFDFKGEEILDIELNYIKYFNSVKEGFNISEGGRGCLGYVRENRKLSEQEAQYIKNLSYFNIYEYHKLAEELQCDRVIISNIAKGKSYRNIKINFNDYEEYKWYEREAEKYRWKNIGESIDMLYNYYIDNPDVFVVPREIRSRIKPEDIDVSWLRNDYKFKDKCDYISKRVKEDKIKKESYKEKECRDILLAIIKYANHQKVSEVTGVSVDKVSRVKCGNIYGKYCKELREEALKIKIFKDPLPDKKEFKEYITTHTFTDAERYYGVSRRTLKRWVEFYDIYVDPKLQYKIKENPNMKLKTEDILKIRKEYDSGLKSCRQLSEEYNISYSQIDRIIKRKAHTNL